MHSPSEPYRYALEVNQGFYERKDVTRGDMVEIPDALEYGNGWLSSH